MAISAIEARRLALGGVQFGLDYGVSNAGGRTTEKEARAILATARAAGVDCIDTAPGYGDSESRLGEWAPRGAFAFVSKTPVLGTPRIGPAAVERTVKSVHQSLERLRVPRLHAVLAHHAGDWLAPGGDRLHAELQKLRQRGLVHKIGVSVYDAAELEAVLALYEIEIVQLPLSLIDQRLWRSGHLRKLKERGIEIHVRSAFLQGALLMAPGALPPALQALRAPLQTLDQLSGGDRLGACLSFLGAIPEIDRVVCGVNSDAQWRAILRAAAAPALAFDFAPFAIDDVRIVNPSKWKRDEAA